MLPNNIFYWWWVKSQRLTVLVLNQILVWSPILHLLMGSIRRGGSPIVISDNNQTVLMIECRKGKTEKGERMLFESCRRLILISSKHSSGLAASHFCLTIKFPLEFQLGETIGGEGSSLDKYWVVWVGLPLQASELLPTVQKNSSLPLACDHPPTHRPKFLNYISKFLQKQKRRWRGVNFLN